jgi:hypothetical protein
MTEIRILRRITLAPQHEGTGRTTHYVGGEIAALPASLAVGSYDDDPGFYLLYYDQGGNELTDTYHDSIEAALEQAEFEFGISSGEWVAVFAGPADASDQPLQESSGKNVDCAAVRSGRRRSSL